MSRRTSYIDVKSWKQTKSNMKPQSVWRAFNTNIATSKPDVKYIGRDFCTVTVQWSF